MQIKLLVVGEKTPIWVNNAVSEYINRIPNEYHFVIQTIPASQRNKKYSKNELRKNEEQLLNKHTPEQSLRVVLDEHGKAWTTLELSENIEFWKQHYRCVCLYVGGPDGFNREFIRQADQVWSVSNLTLPHMLLRVLIVEQIYRACTILQGHPYHRR